MPVVFGSPVRGGATAADEDAEMDGLGVDTVLADETIVDEVPQGMEGVQEMTTKDKIDDWLRHADKDVLRDLGHGENEDADDASGVADKLGGALSLEDLGPVDQQEERAREKEARRNASRRASMASHSLTQSLSALPSTTSPMLAPGKDVKGKGRAVSTSYPSAPAAHDPPGLEDGEKIAAPTSPPRRTHATRLATGTLSTPPNGYKERPLRSAAEDAEQVSGGSADRKGKSKASSESPAALTVLKDCRVFVDVRTEEGDDSGQLFVDMLRSLGAKVGARCE